MNYELSEKRKEIKRKLRKLDNLPINFCVIRNLNQMIENEKVSLFQIAEYIEKDYNLTIKLLKLANSAFYGFPRKISTVKQALMFLGVNVLKILVITIPAFEAIQKENYELWEHLTGVATCAKIIAEQTNISDPIEIATIATAGLLHDIGKIIEIFIFKEEFQKIVSSTSQEKTFYQAEKETIGIDHAEIGAFLMNQWIFPENLIEPVLFHHNPENSKQFKKEAFIIHLADFLIHTSGFGNSFNCKIPPLNPKTFQYLNLDESKIKNILLTLEPKLYELKFFVDLDSSLADCKL